MPDLTKLSGVSSLAGFKNYNSGTATASVAAQTLPTGGYVTTSLSIPLNNSNAITTSKITYSVENFSRQCTGTTNTGLIGSGYSITSISYYLNSAFNVQIYVVDQTGAGVTIPAIGIQVDARLYVAPFNIAS